MDNEQNRELDELSKQVVALHPEWNIPYDQLTSDYILEKLPQFIERDNENCIFQLVHTYKDWTAEYVWFGHIENSVNTVFETSSDTPLKALLKLTIVLYKAGELS